MRYFRIYLLFFFFSFYNSYKIEAQSTFTNKPQITLKKFNAENGFNVFEIYSSAFDDLGWLWISGSNLQLVNEEIDSRSVIIQRFDGNKFHTVTLPEFDTLPIGAHLFKRKDGQFYTIFNLKTKYEIYLLNPNNLTFKKVEFPDKKFYAVNLFAFKDFHIAFLKSANKVVVYKLTNDLKFSKFSKNFTIEFEKKTTPYISNFIDLGDEFLVSDFRSGIYMFQENGKLKQKLTFDDFGLKKSKANRFLTIDTWYRKGNIAYVYFNNIKDVYQYNSTTRTWKLAQNPLFEKEDKFDVKWFNRDEKENLIYQKSNENGSSFTFKPSNSDTFEQLQITDKNKFEVASRDISKELFLLKEGEIFQYSFSKPVVNTFLKKESIRSMLQITSDEILVGTENNGLFLINLTSKIVEKFNTKFKKKEKISISSRAIFEDDTYYWTNSSNGITWINKKTKLANEEVYYPPSTLIEDENYIYYGTNRFKLLKFDKKTKTTSVITETSAYDIQQILKIENRFYMACAEGLLLYENGKKTLLKPSENGNDNFLLTINKHPKHGILLGSHSGKLYQFHPENNNFSLLYTDELKASIATILFDDKQHIWLNTFNGIVALDENNNIVSKFTTNDGLSFFEANRYSALKTKNGNFLVGTLQGLSYFNPNEISKKEINATLKLTSISYFDKNENKETKELSPNKLAELKSISLPPESKNLHIEFGLFGIFDSQKTKYRYRLNESTWIYLTNQSEIRLQNLSAGNYDLQIEAVDSINNRIGNPVFLAIDIDEFFYKTFWFYLFLILFITSIGTWYFLEEKKKYKLKEQFSAKVISSQENERTRVAKELHDSIGQRLLVLKNTVAQKENANTQELQMINGVIDEVRTISHNLHPFQFQQIGLQKSLSNLLNEFQKSSTVFYSYEMDDFKGVLSLEKQLFIFRILQECVVNVEKHANATACKLTVFHKNKSLIFELKDNGKGFDINSKEKLEGIGLRNLKERVSYINATFSIQSIIKKGTTITIKVNK